MIATSVPQAPATSEALSLTNQQLEELVLAQRHFFKSGATLSYEFRKGQLGVLKRALERHEKNLTEALHADLHKDAFEAYGTEFGPLYAEINHTLKHLRSWMQPERKPTPLMFFPSRSYMVRVPLGVTLHISPWNYPLQLLLSSLVPAIAGGNTAILKPSELAPATSEAIRVMIEETFEPEYIAAITGPGHLVTSQLIEAYHFDHIFYTGSPAVGKIIMQAAARHLSPVTLELGGKSPCIVAADANLAFAARKIVFAKLMNAGQTCVANDYLLVHESIKDALVEKLKAELDKQLGGDAQRSQAYGRIINQRQFRRLCGYLADGTIVYGGHTSEADKFIEPTLLTDVHHDAAVMQDEIFGPILPIITYSTNEEVLSIIDRNPYPLALYVYTSSRQTADFFINRVRFGGGCINNGLVHLGNPDLPFGGVGTSGMGAYHGKDGFDTFTHRKSIMHTPTWIDAPLWYAPRKSWYLNVLKRLMR
jgi:aldehyde dehydrogenase (NAD+)